MTYAPQNLVDEIYKLGYMDGPEDPNRIIANFVQMKIEQTEKEWEKIGESKMKQKIIEAIPKEKPMSVFSFVVKGEELELFMRHKGYNKCRAEIKDIINLL